MVRITKGSYGRKVGKTVLPVYAGETVELAQEQEERLVRLGVAEYVTAEPQADADKKETDESGLPEYNEDMKLQELKEIAEKYGVDASAAKSKKEVIAAIEAAQELPDLGDGDEAVVE